MPNDATVFKWGNSLADRRAKLKAGDSLALEVSGDGEIVLRARRPRYRLEDLVDRITPRNRHKETDWGPPAGKEAALLG